MKKTKQTMVPNIEKDKNKHSPRKRNKNISILRANK